MINLSFPIVTAGKVTGKWLSTGTSKGGITSAFYAYFSEKKGYNDIDVYIPFCAPFCKSLNDPPIGVFIEQQAYSDMPEVREKLIAFAKSIYQDTPFNHYLVKLSYVPIKTWMDYIPDPYDESSFEYAYEFITMDDGALYEYIDNHPLANTRQTDEEKLLNNRKNDSEMPYDVQAFLELGYYIQTYTFMNDAPELVHYYLNGLLKNTKSEYARYKSRYSNDTTFDFLNNFLPATQKKMVFVYGANDPWTGAAIENPTNPNVKKFIVTQGTHNDYINDEYYCPANEYHQIMDAINNFLK